MVAAWLATNWHNPRPALTREAAAVVKQHVEDAVAGSGNAWRLHSRARGRHGICGLLALTVRSIAPLGETDALIAEAVSHIVVADPYGFTDRLLSDLVAHLVSDMVISAWGEPIAQTRDVVRALRLLAVATCPTPDRHREVPRSPTPTCVAECTAPRTL